MNRYYLIYVVLNNEIYLTDGKKCYGLDGNEHTVELSSTDKYNYLSIEVERVFCSGIYNAPLKSLIYILNVFPEFYDLKDQLLSFFYCGIVNYLKYVMPYKDYEEHCGGIIL